MNPGHDALQCIPGHSRLNFSNNYWVFIHYSLRKLRNRRKNEQIIKYMNHVVSDVKHTLHVFCGNTVSVLHECMPMIIDSHTRVFDVRAFVNLCARACV